MPNKAETFARSETHINLMRAFAGESQARNRYTIAAGMAREKNLYVVQQAFLFTADQELTLSLIHILSAIALWMIF